MSRRPRPLALPWVLLCLVAYLGSAAHFALVQHRTCLEHGEWVHEGEAASGETLAQARVSPEAPGVSSSALPAVAHGVDDHCAHAFLRREMPPATQVTSPLRLSPPEESPRVVVRDFVRPPVAWLRLAPKASPPRV